ncbi:hypothetical protein Bca52824_002144 [Brassica carinata]|uniref:NAC domain-containing protein n=1 Tax=Brassica carinata TaxID=52824 RepID=A0A8X7WJN1_BRACI|nr:hypothetical protein Bca52824_002144 [Brassica carinata]
MSWSLPSESYIGYTKPLHLVVTHPQRFMDMAGVDAVKLWPLGHLDTISSQSHLFALNQTINAPIPSIDLSMIKSKDHVWYFLPPKEYTSTKKNVMKRTTPSGFWKSTGNDRNVRKDKRRNGVVIGTKKTLVYHEGKSSSAVRSPWTMHEYNITCLPLVDQRTYVICKIFYKGNAGDIPSSINSSEPSHSLVIDDSNIVGAANTPPLGDQAGEESLYGFSVNDVTMITEKQEHLCPWDALCSIPNTLSIDNNDNPNGQLQAPCLARDDDGFLGGLTHVNRKHVEFLFIYDQELTTEENSREL